jgi:succinate-acetate transporter protein
MYQPSNNPRFSLFFFNIFALLLLGTGIVHGSALFIIFGSITLAFGLCNTVKWANLPRDTDQK